MASRTRRWLWGGMVLLLAVIASLLVWVLPSLDWWRPRSVGFVGNLSGRSADVAVAARNGAELAVEEWNDSRPFWQRPLALVVGDDGNDAARAATVDRGLIERGVWGIVGHVTSVASMGAVPVADQTGIALVSPTTSTNALSGKRDAFFRVYPASAQTASLLARHAFRELQRRRVAAVIDVGNRAHTMSSFQAFRARWEALGGEVVHVEEFVSSRDSALLPLAQAIAASEPDTVYLLANAMDSALIAQQFRKLGGRYQLLATDWAMTPDVIAHGGEAVEGLTALHSVNMQSQEPRYLAFRDRYLERFGKDPTFAAVHGYDATRLLLHAVSESAAPRDVLAHLQRIETFPTLMGEIELDAWGDVLRDHWVVRVQRGQFVVGERTR